MKQAGRAVEFRTTQKARNGARPQERQSRRGGTRDRAPGWTSRYAALESPPHQ